VRGWRHLLWLIPKKQLTSISGQVQSSPLVQWLRLAIFKRPNTVGAFIPSPDEGNRSSFQNVLLPNYLQFRTMDKVRKPSDSERYTRPSEPFRLHMHLSLPCTLQAYTIPHLITTIADDYKLCRSSLCNFLQTSLTLSLSAPYILLNSLLSSSSVQVQGIIQWRHRLMELPAFLKETGQKRVFNLVRKKGNRFSVFHSIQTGYEARPPSRVARCLSPGIREPGREAHNSPPSSVEVKNCGAVSSLLCMSSRCAP
jgi:hypothetical protein